MNTTENNQTTDGPANPQPLAGCAPLDGLAADIARCNGSATVEDGVQYWREGCETCLRRTAARPDRVWMIAPPAIVAFECEYLIEPNDQEEQSQPGMRSATQGGK